MNNKFLILMLTVGITAPVWAAKERGGGKAVVCRSTSGAVISAELLDIFETNVVRPYGLSPSPNVTLEQAIDSFHNATYNYMKPISYGHAEPNLSYFIESEVAAAKYRARYVVGLGIKPVDDAAEFYTAKGNCQLEQLAYYTTNNELIIDKEIYDKLDVLSERAFWLHEGLYKFLRTAEWNDDSSVRTRRAVGLAFSGYQFEMDTKLLTTKFILCTTNVSGLSGGIYENEGDTTTVFFTNRNASFLFINGKRTLGLTYTPANIGGKGKDGFPVVNPTYSYDLDLTSPTQPLWSAVDADAAIHIKMENRTGKSKIVAIYDDGNTVSKKTMRCFRLDQMGYYADPVEWLETK